MKSVEAYTGTLIHEFVHAYTDTDDETIEFESGLTNMLGKIATMVITSKEKIHGSNECSSFRKYVNLLLLPNVEAGASRDNDKNGKECSLPFLNRFISPRFYLIGIKLLLYNRIKIFSALSELLNFERWSFCILTFVLFQFKCFCPTVSYADNDILVHVYFSARKRSIHSSMIAISLS